MTDIRRTLLWVVFTMSLVLLWDGWNKQNGHPSMFGPRPAATQPAAVAPAVDGTVPMAAPGAASQAVVGAAVPPTPVTAPAASPRVTVTTDLVQAVIDTKGGDLIRLELLKQQEHVQRAWYEPFFALFKTDTNASTVGKNVVLFDQSAQRLYLAQTGLISAQGGANLPSHATAMTLVPGDTALKDGQNELQVKLESAVVGGAKLIKTYTFKRGDYVIDVKHEVVNTSTAPIDPQLYLQLVRDGNAPPGESSLYFTFTGPALYTDASKFHKLDFKKIESGAVEHDKSGDNGWVAMVQHYFASAWLLGGSGNAKQPREFFTRKVATNQYSVGMIVPLGTVAPGQTKTQEARLFAGPQEEDKLAALAPGLELVKDYGWFTILAKPLFWLLTQLHKVIGNWGWAIVSLVVLLKIAFFWLNAHAYRSMAKMKAVNPKVMEMRERLKDKPQQLQQEMMRIYREEKVNPLGGCLPIVAQMPFFIALYWVLLSTVEMRNTPWIGWIHDLSLPDPYFILPLLMTASSLVQTALNPRPPDPVQAKMMWFMPLIFSVMFFFFPAGLVLYWLTNNILSIAQQWLINKQMGVLKTP
jgi:YidC/Oxa1 family membrane protein insertase